MRFPRCPTFLCIQSVSARAPDLEHHLPLNVREAFFGIRINASRLYCKLDDCEKVEYVNFTSLYPYVNARAIFPLGHPETIVCPSLSKLHQGEFFRVAKCTLLLPRALFHPILPSKINDKLMFPLCRTCAETNTVRCSHIDEERVVRAHVLRKSTWHLLTDTY